MPDFSAKTTAFFAKPSVVSDGEVVTVGSDGYTVTSTLSSFSAFHSNPSRSAAGVWSVQMKDTAFKVVDVDVKTLLTTGNYLSTQLKPTTTATGGQLILNWVFNVAGTPTDLPASGSFLIYVVYGWTSF
jgi:hypothetical protein